MRTGEKEPGGPITFERDLIGVGGWLIKGSVIQGAVIENLVIKCSVEECSVASCSASDTVNSDTVNSDNVNSDTVNSDNVKDVGSRTAFATVASTDVARLFPRWGVGTDRALFELNFQPRFELSAAGDARA